MRLLPFGELLATGPVDHADWNYRPLLGYISRLRFKLALELLPAKADALLEVGFGSGIFLPELSRHCTQLYGLDIHDRVHGVSAILARSGIEANLRAGSVAAMPFPTDMFDCIVAVSALEFVSDIHAAVRELARVLRPDGRLVVVMPGHSPIVDLSLRLLTGQVARREYGERREHLVPALLSSFAIEQRTQVPAFSCGLGPLYVAMRLMPRP